MLDVTKPSHSTSAIPFDAGKLDRLMEEAGIDLLVVTSKHNVQYLLGGHRAFFFESFRTTLAAVAVAQRCFARAGVQYLFASYIGDDTLKSLAIHAKHLVDSIS